MRTLLLLSTGGTDCAADYVRHSVGEMIALEIEECFPAGLTWPGLMIKSVADSLNAQDFRQAPQMAGYLCCHWYRYSGHDPTVWRDVSLGEVAEHHFYNYFVQLLHGLTLAKRCLEQYRPEQVVFCGTTNSPFKQPFAYLADHMGIPFVEHRLAQDQNSGKRPSNCAISAVKRRMAFHKIASGGRLLFNWTRSTLAEAMWHLPLVQQTRLELRRWWRLRQREDRTVAMITPFHSLNWLVRLLKKDKRFYVIELDREKVRSLDWLRQNYLTRHTWHEIEAIRNGRDEHYEQVWSSMEADALLREQFLFEGISYWPLARDELRRFVTSLLGQSMTILEAQHILLETENAHLLLFLMPFGGGQRTLVNLAHLRPDIQAAVYPEAVYFYKDACRPFFTRVDYLLAWGEADVELFPELGYRRQQIKIIGRQDDLRQPGKLPHPEKNAPSLTSRISQRNGKKLIVYFDTTPWPLYLGLTQRLMETIAKLMALLPEYDLAFRPHPRFDRTGFGRTERRLAFVRELNLPNVYLADARQESLDTIIHAADLGITLGSAVIYELLVANKPVVVPAWLPWARESGREINPLPEVELCALNLRQALFIVRTPDDWVATLRYILEHPEAWLSKQEARQRFLTRQVDSQVNAAEVLLSMQHQTRL